MSTAAALLGSYFDHDDLSPSDLPPYFTLGARRPKVGTAAMDSSDQSVVLFDQVTGVAACRSGINLVGPDLEVSRRSVGNIVYVVCNPTAPADAQLRSKLAIEQSMRLATGRRPIYSSLRSALPMLPPRLVSAKVRVVEDHHRLQLFGNSVYAQPGLLLMADGRLNAQNFPGAAAVDALARLLRARGVRYISLAKDGLLVSAVRREARAIRCRVGNAPFAFPILKRHLLLAYRGPGQAGKTLRHGSSSAAFGGVGAFRFALSISGDHLCIVEMSLYNFRVFASIIPTGERLEGFVCRLRGVQPNARNQYPAVFSWHLLEFVTATDFERHVVPTLEEVVYTAYSDTELGIYPRALADIHNHIKLRHDDPELEQQRRRIVTDLARMGIPPELVPITPEGPHKTDPEEFDFETD